MTCISGVGIGNKNNYVYTDNGKVYKKPDTVQNVTGTLAGLTAASCTQKGVQKIFSIPIMNFMKSQAHGSWSIGNRIMSTMSADNIAYKEAAKAAFEHSVLPAKGVKLFNAEGQSAAVLDVIKKEMPKVLTANKTLSRIIEQRIIKPAANATVEGKNALFAAKSQKVVVNMEKASFFAFHEMGHALNKNASKIGKFLQKSRVLCGVTGAFALYTAIFKRKKAEGEEPKGIFDKATTFIKEHAGKIAFLSMLPVVVEETMASVKGAKLAKGLLSPELYKNLNKIHAKAGLTYIGAAIGMGLAAYIGKTVRDAIAGPKEVHKA